VGPAIGQSLPIAIGVMISPLPIVAVVLMLLSDNAKANAFLNKRGYVIPEDVRSISKDVLRHRIGLTYEAEAESVNVEHIIDEVLKVIPIP